MLGVSVQIMKEGDQIFVAKYVAKKLQTKDLVEFADRKLKEGIYFESLLNIIDQDPQVWETVFPCFEKALKDMDIKIPSFENAIRFLLRHHIQNIASGNVDPRSQFRQMLDDVEHFDIDKNTKKYVGDAVGIENLYSLYYAVDDLDNPFSIEAIDKINQDMIDESKKWLKKY